MDELGRPVTDLAAEELAVAENGGSRPIQTARPANGPMRIALLVDTSEATRSILTHIRAGVLAFLDAVPPQHEIALATMGGQFRVRVPPTTDQKKLRESAEGIFADTGSANTLIDSLIDARRRFFVADEVRWPVFVLVTTDGPDTSGAGREQAFNRFLRELRGTGTTIHTVMLSARASGVAQLVASVLAETSGGYYEAIAASSGLTQRMLEVVDRIADDDERMKDWYRVTYTPTPGDGDGTRQVTATVSRLGVSVEVAPDRPRFRPR